MKLGIKHASSRTGRSHGIPSLNPNSAIIKGKEREGNYEGGGGRN